MQISLIKFSQLVDITQLQRLLQLLFEMTGMPVRLVDHDNTVLVSVGEQELCEGFFRNNLESCLICQKNDEEIFQQLQRKEYILTECGNGLQCLALPIKVNEEHFATIFLQPFFLKKITDKVIDQFSEKAEHFGFEQEEFIQALKKVPVFNKKEIQIIRDYYSNFVNLLSVLGYKHVQLEREVLERSFIEETLRDSEERFRVIYESARDFIILKDFNLCYERINPAGEKFLKFSSEEVIGKKAEEILDEEDAILEYDKDIQVLAGEIVEEEIVRKDGDQEKTYHVIKVPIKNSKGEISGLCGIGRDITERRKMEVRLVEQAMYDQLTGLPNRRLLEDRLKASLAQAHRSISNISVAFMGLDRFKDINDTLGHAVGDELLIQVANRLSKITRNSDTLSRVGNDEFVVILNNLKKTSDAYKVIKKILEVFKKKFNVEGNDLYITASTGFSIYPDDGTDSISLFRNADSAMAFAKASGKNVIRRYEPAMHQLAHERLNVTNRLRKAVEQKEFVLYYQPQIDMANQKVFGLEALVRWENPDLGIVPPSSFIPLAEESGLIHALGEWVFEDVSRQLLIWQKEGKPKLRVAVNVSPVQMLHHDFIDKVERILKTNGISAENLTIEITESMFMQDIEDTVERLKHLRRLGAHVDVDDFGTVYSSLAYLRTLPLDTLKIDKTFIDDLSATSHGNIDPAALVKAIITLGHGLNLKVLAEGIETQHQLDMLQSLGCDLAQGYLFAKPVPAADVWNVVEDINRKLIKLGVKPD
ncbi:MAG: EAL domain-containing protein [Anaerolineaceae bacterium]|nr:EAL domain-containing protein [Anaerolineaceae bacterium]